MTKVPFLDLPAQYKTVKIELDQAIKSVIDRQVFILGPELEAFESEFAKYLGVKYVVGVGSGTDALIFSLTSLGLGKGDEIITPVNSFIATTTAIIQIGATPVFVDCNPITYQIDVSQVRNKISKKTKAILPVHLYGAPFDLGEIGEVVKKNNLFLIEDAAQAHGATYKSKKIGSFGDLSAWSFYPAKNLGAYGDGGAVSTNNEELYKKLLMLRNYGQVKKYYHKTYGINSRLDEIQAAILRVKLKYLDEWNLKRNKIAGIYEQKVKGYKFQEQISETSSSYHIFSVEHPDRNNLQKYLEKNGISSQIHYPVPIHLQEVYRSLGYSLGDFPAAEKIANQILSIPMFPELTDEQIDHISASLNSY